MEHDTHIDNLLRVGSDMANANGARMHLLHVIRAAPVVVSQFLPESYEKMASERIEAELAGLAAKVDLAAGAAVVAVRFGDVYQEILAHAANIGADLIIVASHKPNVADYLLGTTASRIVRHAACSVFVARLDKATD